MDRFEALPKRAETKKTLIYGGQKGQYRSNYTILSWKDISQK